MSLPRLPKLGPASFAFLCVGLLLGLFFVLEALIAQSDPAPNPQQVRIDALSIERDANGLEYPVLVYTRTNHPVAPSYEIEVSADLRQWVTLQAGEFQEQQVTAGSNGTETVKVRIQSPIAGASAKFFRLKTSSVFLSESPSTANTNNINDSTAVSYTSLFHDRRTGQSSVNLTISNTNASPFAVPSLLLVIDTISDPSVTIVNADGMTPEGKPFFDFTGQVPGNALDPGETTARRPAVFNNPNLRPFTVQVSVFHQVTGVPSGNVTLSLTTDENHSVIMKSEAAPFRGLLQGVGELLSVAVNGSTEPTEVRIEQVQQPSGRGQLFFGANDTATSTTVTTSGGTPNQANIVVRHAQTSAFKGDMELRASVGGELRAEKFVTAISAAVSPKCVYVSDQRPVSQTLTVVPAIQGLRFDAQSFAIHTDIAAPSSLGSPANPIITDDNGTAQSNARNGGYDAYLMIQLSAQRSASSTPLHVASPSSPSDPPPPPPPTTFCDKKTPTTSDPPGNPYTEPGPGTQICSTCPNGPPSHTGKSVDLSDGEKKLFPVDLSIPGRGFDFEFRRTYRGFNYRRTFDRKDFGENWTYTYADEFLVKDGSGADTDANYVFFRDGQAAYMFVRTASGVWAPAPQQFTQLRINPSTGDFEARHQSGMVEVFHNFSAMTTPNVNGQLKEMRDRNGNVMHFIYSQPAGLSKFVLTTVVDTMGRSIVYRYYLDSDPNPGRRGRLMEIEDFRRDNSLTGRKVNFDYDAEGNLVRASGPAVTGTPNGNDFPLGKTFRYQYITTADLPGGLTQEQQDRLLHKLTRIWYPNEVGNNPIVNPADSLAAERLTYETNPSSPFFGFVTAYTVGGINANGVPAGGTIRYTYTDLNPTRAMPPGVNLDPTLLIHLQSLQVDVQDRNGNRAEYIWGGENKLLRYTEFTRGLRASEPSGYTMTYQYNADRLLLRRTHPEGNRIEWTYDETNPNRYQQGNLLTMTRIPDAARGGDQTQLTTRYVYDPVYNQPCLIIEPRGTDPGFVPPFGGPASPIRYSMFYVFDYQEGPNNDAHKQRLADELGVSLAEIKDIIERNEAQVEAALGLPAGSFTLLGRGDVNGDGLTDQIHGNHLQKNMPRVRLLTGSNQAAIEGDTLQEIVETYTYNQFGQLLSRVDSEANVHTYQYFLEIDPGGDGSPTPAPMDGRMLDPTTGGYLKETATDTASNPIRNNRLNPAPVNIRTSFAYDDVGNVVRMTNGRGIRTDLFVNELNQIVQTIRAADISGAATADPADPLIGDPAGPLTAFAYLERTFYDFNDNVVQRQVEDRGDTSNTGGFVDSTYQYDILDNQLQMVQEVDITRNLITRYRYDANENRVMTIQPEGNADSALYDERDLLFQSTRGANSRPSAGLFGAGDPATFDRPGGAGTVPSTTTHHYDRNANMIETVDAQDHGGTKSTFGGVGDVTRFTFDGFDRRRTVTDPLGNRTEFSYDPASNLIRTIQNGDPIDDVAGSAENKTLGVTESIHDELSRVVATHRVLFQTPDVTSARSPTLTDTPTMDTLAPYQADANNDTAAVPGGVAIAVIGRVTTLTEYDRASRVTFTVQDDLDTYRSDYDGASRVIKTTDSALNNGFAGGAFNPTTMSGNTVETAYDDNNNPIERKETDVSSLPGVVPEVFRTTFIYDSLNRVQTMFDNLGQAEDYRYDSRNNLVAQADAVGPLTTRTFNRRGLGSSQLVLVNDFGNVTRTRYDGLNRILETEARLTATGQGDGINIGATIEGVPSTAPAADPGQSGDGLISVYYAWDDNSQLLALRDDNGNTTAYIYDNQGRMLVERKGLNYIGTIFTVSGGDNGSFNVALRGGAAPVDTEAAGTDITYAYDPDNNPQTRIDEAGNVFTCTFDALNRKKACTIAREAGFIGTTIQNWSYDGLSRQTHCFDNNEPASADDDVLCAYFFDSLSRKIEEQQKIGALPAKAISCNFDIAAAKSVSQCSADIYPDGRQVNCVYDTLDRLLSRRDAGQSTDIGHYDYIGSWRVAALTYQNNTRLAHLNGSNDSGFDRLRRIVNHRWEAFTNGQSHGTGTRIVEFGHRDGLGNPAYDRANNKFIEEKLHDPDNSEAYRYDSVYRLTTFDRGLLNTGKTIIATLTITPGALQQQRWSLDGLGNWNTNTHRTDGVLSMENRTHSDFNEIVTSTGMPYGGGPGGTHVLDKNGNLTDDGTLLLHWDPINRLQRVSRKSDGQPIADYTYDCHNRRLRKEVSNGGMTGTATNGKTDFYYDGWRVLEERDGSDAVTQQYVYGNYLDEVWTLDNRRSGITVAQLNDGAGNQRHFYHCNTLYSVFGLTDETGALKEAYQYDAYGRQTVINDGNDGDTVVNFSTNDVRSVDGASSVSNPYMYTGQRFDPETKMMYYKNRYYAPSLGRFISRDPIGYYGGLNLYEYVASMPTYWVDPFGFKKITIAITFADDSTTAWAGRWHKAGSVFHDLWDWGSDSESESENVRSLDDAIEQILKRGTWYDPTGKSKDCIEKVIFVGHGGAGEWGSHSDSDKKEGKEKGKGNVILREEDLSHPDSPGSRNFAKLKDKWCTGAEGVELQICMQAEGDEGKALMKNLAIRVNAKVKGWDDWYYGRPTGYEYTAKPDGTIEKTDDTGLVSGGDPPKPRFPGFRSGQRQYPAFWSAGE